AAAAWQLEDVGSELADADGLADAEAYIAHVDSSTDVESDLAAAASPEGPFSASRDADGAPAARRFDATAPAASKDAAPEKDIVLGEISLAGVIAELDASSESDEPYAAEGPEAAFDAKAAVSMLLAKSGLLRKAGLAPGAADAADD